MTRHPAADHPRRGVQHRRHADDGRRGQDAGDRHPAGDGDAGVVDPPSLPAQGIVIGVVGTALGLLLGLGAAYRLDSYKLIPLDPDGLFHRSSAGRDGSRWTSR